MTGKLAKLVQLSFQIEEETRDALQHLADADKRKLSPYIRILLEEHIAAKKAAAKRK
jgi:hypothetical protein